MSFDDIVSVLGRAFGLELKVVQDTTVFEVDSEDGSTKVQIVIHYVSERRLVLMSADLGEPPPDGGGFVFDCRAMPNPFWDETLRGYTGRDKPVCDFFARFPETVEPFLEATETLVRQSIEQYKRDGRDHLQVAFGCTGGQHRSVYFAERMAERLSGIEDVEIEVSHTAKQYWTTNHAKENRDIIFQEELR